KVLRVKSLVSAMKGDHPGAAHFKEVSWVNYRAHTLISRVYDDAGRELYATERKFPEFTPLSALLFETHAETLIREMARGGLPVKEDEKESERATDAEDIRRWQNTLAWVIGPGSSDQLWLEKDTFLPLRYLTDKPDTQEIRFNGYRFYDKYF